MQNKIFVVPIPDGSDRDFRSAESAQAKASLAMHEANMAYSKALSSLIRKFQPEPVRLQNENRMQDAFPERYETRFSEDGKFLVFYIDTESQKGLG